MPPRGARWWMRSSRRKATSDKRFDGPNLELLALIRDVAAIAKESPPDLCAVLVKTIELALYPSMVVSLSDVKEWQAAPTLYPSMVGSAAGDLAKWIGARDREI
jgi:hypothetical protein